MEDEEDDAKPDDGSTLSDEHGWREEKTRQGKKMDWPVWTKMHIKGVHFNTTF